MARRHATALAILGILSLLAAGSSQAGWGGHSETTQTEESMLESRPAPEGTAGAYEYAGPHWSEGEGPLETGRLPESERFGSNVIFGDDVEMRLREGFLPGGGP